MAGTQTDGNTTDTRKIFLADEIDFEQPHLGQRPDPVVDHLIRRVGSHSSGAVWSVSVAATAGVWVLS